MSAGITTPLYNQNIVSGMFWHDAGPGSVPYTTDMTNFDIKRYAVATGTSPENYLYYYLTGGDHAPGEIPVVALEYSDGVTTKNVVCSLRILNPALPIPDPVDPYAISTPGSDFVAPPNAVGVPNQSYDIYDYKVIGTENWTPTTNPIATLYGGNATVPVIRIEHNLTIPAGARLSIYGGQRIEMGPNAKIIVERASSPSGHGGFLGISGATVTAYRGCNNDEHSTWAGIQVMGNPAWSQGSWPISPKGKLWLFDAVISYADAGVQNGGGTTTSGGMIQSGGGNRFNNNKLSAMFWPYINIVSGTEHYSTESLYGSQFTCDDNAWFPINAFVGAFGVKGFYVGSCLFKNSSSHDVNYGLYMFDAGTYIAGSTFKGFKNAINDFSLSGTKTVTVSNCQFENNHFGVYSAGSFAPAIQASTFNIPAYSSPLLPTYYPGSTVLLVNDQNAGVVMQSSTGYNITTNTFTTDAAASNHYYPFTSGTIQYATGSDPNLVTDNTFAGVGVAMLSNFINNNTSGSGLQYQCNSDNYVGFDISVLGRNIIDGGINMFQKTNTATGFASSGNKFAPTASMNIYDKQRPIYYARLSGSVIETPVHRYGPVTDVALLAPAKCYSLPGGSTSSSSISATTRREGSLEASVSAAEVVKTADANGDKIDLTELENDNDRTIRFREAAYNLNYYLNDTVPHPRDSVYYWAAELRSPYGDLLTTNLLIEDSLIDSAITFYKTIPANYKLSEVEANDFIVGTELINLLAKQRTNGTDIFSLEKDDIATLKWIKDNSSMWAHARAEGWLNVVTGEDLVDSLLYPDTTIADTTIIDTTRTDTTTYGQKHFAKNNQNNNAVKVYPSPVHDKISVEVTSNSTEDIVFQLLDVTGRSILSQLITANHANEISVEKIQPGIYIYRVIQGNKPMKTGKLVKD